MSLADTSDCDPLYTQFSLGKCSVSRVVLNTLKDFEQETNITRESKGIGSVCVGGGSGASSLSLELGFPLSFGSSD